MEKFHSSPFMLNRRGRNSIHIMTREEGFEEMLELVCLPDYKIFKPRLFEQDFDKNKALNIPTL
jgi:hypothetical protein